MEDLFKQFRENLEGRPEPAFDKRDWQSLEKQLGPLPEKRRGAFLWWLVLPFMLLMAGSNAFFFWQWKKAAQQVSSLDISRDTVFHTRVIHTTDTIYRTRVLREKVVEYQMLPTQDPAYLPGRTLRAEAQANTRFLDVQHQPLETNTTLGQNGLAENQRLVQNFEHLPIREIQPLQYNRPHLGPTDYLTNITVKKQKKTLLAHLSTARPKGFQLGVSGGGAYPFGNGLGFKSGYSVGLHAAVEFSPGLRLWADAAYFKTTFLTDRMGDDIGVPFENPPSDDYAFLQAEVPQPFFQYAVGLQYLFRTKHRLQPFVSLGLGAISLLPYDVAYEFKNTILDIEWDLDRTIHRQGLITNFLLFPIGLEYRFSKHWNGQIQTTYRYNWKSTGVQSPNMLGIQGGLNYRF